MAGPPPELTARAMSCTWASACTASPLGTRGAAGSWGGPHTPSGNAPYGSGVTWPKGQACAAAPLVHRRVSVGVTLATPMGPMPSVWVGWNVLGLPSTSSAVAGTVVVTVMTNSAVTTNGRPGVPSGGSGVGPPPARGGIAPSLTIDEMACATPAAASSRYFGTNSPAVRLGVALSSNDPNLTVTSQGPTSKVALPWKSGPSTSSGRPATRRS